MEKGFSRSFVPNYEHMEESNSGFSDCLSSVLPLGDIGTCAFTSESMLRLRPESI